MLNSKVYVLRASGGKANVFGSSLAGLLVGKTAAIIALKSTNRTKAGPENCEVSMRPQTSAFPIRERHK